MPWEFEDEDIEDTDIHSDEEPSDIEWLRDLSDRLWHIPPIYDVDQYDSDRCLALARQLEEKRRSSR